MFLVPVSRHASELTRGFDRLFDDTFERFFGLAPQADSNQGQGASRSPALDVTESERAFTVHLDVPGVAKEDVKIAIDGRRVTVEGQTRKDEEKKEGERVVYRERSASSFSRSFSLPLEIDQAESQAKLDNGVLTLTLAKRGATTAAQLTVS
jgi:HSP20 family protein